jgi:hypothetical protein
MLKRVLFLFAIGMLMLMPALGCASTSSNEAKLEKPVIYNFSAVSSTVKGSVEPQFNYQVSTNTKSIKIIGPDGAVIIETPVAADGNPVIRVGGLQLQTTGVYPANFKGAAFGKPAKQINKQLPSEKQVFTLTASNDAGQATATCSITVVSALTPSTK